MEKLLGCTKTGCIALPEYLVAPTIYPQKIVIDFFAPADYYICNIDSLCWRILDSKTISGRIRKCAIRVAVAQKRKKQPKRKRAKRKLGKRNNQSLPILSLVERPKGQKEKIKKKAHKPTSSLVPRLDSCFRRNNRLNKFLGCARNDKHRSSIINYDDIFWDCDYVSVGGAEELFYFSAVLAG